MNKEEKIETIQSLLFTIGILTSEVQKYIHCLHPMTNHNFKNILTDCRNANNRLLNQYNKDIPEDIRENLSEVFGSVVESLKGKSVDEQVKLIALLADWESGNVQIID